METGAVEARAELEAEMRREVEAEAERKNGSEAGSAGGLDQRRHRSNAQ